MIRSRVAAFVMILVAAFSAARVAAQFFSVPLPRGNTLHFAVSDSVPNEVTVVAPYDGYARPRGAVAIPESVEWQGRRYAVTAIGEWAFASCDELRMVTLPTTLRYVGAYAFYGCTALNERLSIPAGVRYIGNSAFYGCRRLPEVSYGADSCEYMGGSLSGTVFGNCTALKRIIVRAGVKTIPDYAFCGLDALTTMAPLPSSLTRIGAYAFAYCTSLKGDLVVPDSVVSIGECAFHQCHAVESVTLGRHLRQIGSRAFFQCIGLRTLTVRGYHPCDVMDNTFSDVPTMVRLRVPCVSKGLYAKAEFWRRMGTFETFGDCTFTIYGAMDNPDAGVVMGAGEYGFGDSVSLMAVCAAGYGFDGWSDGNRENPRVFSPKGSESFVALTRPSGTVKIVDTVYQVDTVYRDGFKVIHDTVDLQEVAQSINGLKEVVFDRARKCLTWNFPRSEKVISVSLFNQSGECVYTGDGHKGKVKMKRLPSGTYIVRIETIRRVLRCRFFMNSDSSWGVFDTPMRAQ